MTKTDHVKRRGAYSTTTVLGALFVGVLMGVSIGMNLVFLSQANMFGSEAKEALMSTFLEERQQQVQNVALQRGAVVPSSSISTKTIQAIDCKTHHAEADPNEGMSENSTITFVDEIDPTFWISLHEEDFDPIRWNSIYHDGNYYETGITEQFHEMLHSKPPGIVVDVGMNIGWFTIFSRAMGHKVFSFDPNPIMHSRICTSLKYNHWWDASSSNSGGSSGVTTFAYGLGDKEGSLDLNLGSNPGGSSFIKSHVKGGINRTIHVPVTTLDLLANQMGWLQQNENNIDNNEVIYLLKIDTEGYEAHIVRGATNIIKSGRVRNILVESAPDKKTGSQQILDQFFFFWNAGFQIQRISNAEGNLIRGGVKHAERINYQLKNKEFEGDAEHEFMSKKKCNIWWKHRDDIALE